MAHGKANERVPLAGLDHGMLIWLGQIGFI